MKLFTREEAESMVPILAPLLQEAGLYRREIAISLLEADASAREPTPHVRELKKQVVQLINRIEAHGCVVKDLDLGLIDFPALQDAKPIFLCWKNGETRIEHWHGTDEGFAARKPL